MIKTNKACLYNLHSPKFLISSDNDVFYPPGTRRIPFTWKIYFPLSGEKSQTILLALDAS